MESKRMNILALDCATRTGWAVQLDGHIESGVQDFSRKRGESGNGLIFLRFRGWLINNFKNSGIKVIAYEQAHHRGGASTEIGVNLTGRIQEFAAENNIEYMAVHTGTIKKFATGSGTAGKPAIMDWFKSKTGRAPIDDNEADAMALLWYVKSELGG